MDSGIITGFLKSVVGLHFMSLSSTEGLLSEAFLKSYPENVATYFAIATLANLDHSKIIRFGWIEEVLFAESIGFKYTVGQSDRNWVEIRGTRLSKSVDDAADESHQFNVYVIWSLMRKMASALYPDIIIVDDIDVDDHEMESRLETSTMREKIDSYVQDLLDADVSTVVVDVTEELDDDEATVYEAETYVIPESSKKRKFDEFDQETEKDDFEFESQVVSW
jgi:hypothetical protein